MNKTIIKNVCLIMALFTALVNYVGATIDQSNDKCSVFSEVSENAEPKKLGYGEPRVVAVSPNGTKIALATGIGLWLFELRDIKTSLYVNGFFSRFSYRCWMVIR